MTAKAEGFPGKKITTARNFSFSLPPYSFPSFYAFILFSLNFPFYSLYTTFIHRETAATQKQRYKITNVFLHFLFLSTLSLAFPPLLFLSLPFPFRSLSPNPARKSVRGLLAPLTGSGSEPRSPYAFYFAARISLLMTTIFC